MGLFHTFKAGAMVSLLVAGLPGLAQNVSDPFMTVPYRNPLPLEQLLALDGAAFGQAVAANNGRDFRSTVTPFDPPGASNAIVPLGFAGLRNECLEESTPLACRLYVTELLKIHRTKEGRGAGSANANR
ncbi:hypothetical protein [Noviherbaspirillum aerium]|uniref:hypothetical protein n=1 Tax=Noviherbaspirillum aerium TaxID=2588497 RepID=UPI00124C99D2|nr:hypothetical protein [Noviherbaspirillum aerium]